MLTHKQHELLFFIHQCMQKTGVPPSFDEMKEAVEIASKSGIHRLVVALEERGFIRRLPNRARAMEIIKLPDDIAAQVANSDNTPDKPDLAANVVTVEAGRANRANRDRQKTLKPAADSALWKVPMMGRIAAGVPITAIQNETHRVAVPINMLGAGEHYALEVCGDSMIEAGILDGDTVIIQRMDTAHAGEIVVALVDGEEATLKRYRHKDGAIALEAANPVYKTQHYSPERISIQGRLVGLLRRY